MPERKRVPVHKPYKLGWEKGDVYCFQITGKVPKHMEGYEEYIFFGWGCAERDMVWGYRDQIKYEQQLQNKEANN